MFAGCYFVVVVVVVGCAWKQLTVSQQTESNRVIFLSGRETRCPTVTDCLSRILPNDVPLIVHTVTIP